MFHKQIQAFNSTTYALLRQLKRGRMPQSVLFVIIALLLSGFVQFSSARQEAHATELKVAYTCSHYTIRYGDTLTAIAAKAHVGMMMLARVNSIADVNLIVTAHSLCLPQGKKGTTGQRADRYIASVSSRGAVRWYAYGSLERSTYQQVNTFLRSAAAYYGLPANLLLAIARQESGYQQHVIARDGGIGVMQIMPYTATWINKVTGTVRDPYKLRDNVFMGACYVRILGNSFHWNMARVISAYNEGPWAVTHQGIFNWRYVNNVMAMFHNLR